MFDAETLVDAFYKILTEIEDTYFDQSNLLDIEEDKTNKKTNLSRVQTLIYLYCKK